MVPERSGARALARRDELRKWQGLETDPGTVRRCARTHGDAYRPAAKACRSAHVADAEFVTNNADQRGIGSARCQCESCTNDDRPYDDHNAQDNGRRPRNSWEHDISWTYGTSAGRDDVGRLEVGHDKLVRAYELMANSFIVRLAEP